MGHNVLFADDEVLVRDALKLFCEHLDVTLHCVTDGATCLEEFGSSPRDFDLVIVNYEMPGMGAPDLVPALRRIDANKPIAVTSGFSGHHVFRSLDRKLVSGFLQKPYTLSRVRRFLQAMLPNVEVTVLALSHASARLRGLLPAEQKYKVKMYAQPDDLILDAQRRLAAVIVWALDLGPPTPAQLEMCRSDEIPVVFCGKPSDLNATLSGKERFFFCDGSDSEELIRTIEDACQALPEYT